MYWFLNCLPLIIELSIEIYALYIPIRYNAMENNLMWLWILIVRQIYLLIINIIFINRKKNYISSGNIVHVGGNNYKCWYDVSVSQNTIWRIYRRCPKWYIWFVIRNSDCYCDNCYVDLLFHKSKIFLSSDKTILKTFGCKVL